MSQFVHLHTHSHYSLCDAVGTIPKLIKKACQLNMPALALTDHGNIFGMIEFYNKAKKAGIKPIIGCELYISNSPHTKRSISQGSKNYHHLIVLAKNITGYYNLIKLVSTGYTHGFYYKPRVDKETLKTHSEGLIGLSACLAGEIPFSLLQGDDKKAKAVALDYSELFGKDSFYLELQNHGIDKQIIVNEKLISLSKETNIPLVATNDVHYLNGDDYEAHDTLLCIGQGKKLSDDNRIRYYGREFYFKSFDEMNQIFNKVPEALSNTLVIASLCNVEFDFKDSLPNFDVPKGYTLNNYLKKLCEKGVKQRYKNINSIIIDRMNYELSVICNMGFAGYFLIVQDFIQYAKNSNIGVGPGRGSAAGSLVAYALGITNIDPLKYNLIFERFLSPERISMPDIDTDFQDEKRDEVINYVLNKYGKNKVAGIITFGALKARAVIRDVGRVLDIPLNEVDRLAKLIPAGPGAKLESAYNEIPELKTLIDSNPLYQKLFSLSKKLEGINRHAGTHAAGVVIGHDDLSKIVPLYAEPKSGNLSTQYEGKYLEECGLLKMDFLGLKNLSVVQKCIDIIKTTKNKDLDINNIPLNDQKAYELLKKGNSLGVFQLESSGIQELMKKLKPSIFEDIIALIALYRPGPLNSGMADEFIERKDNPNKIKFDHPLLKSILKETYGVIVYQEQVMEIAREIGGFSMGKADILRKAMGKKLIDKMNILKKDFVDGAVNKKIDKSIAEKLYNLMARFGEYGFNKSHSAAYAMITYQTAYLKANYTIEYMAALLSCDKDNTDKIVEYVADTKSMDIKILSPSINYSYADFTVKNKDIKFGLSAIKNIGINSVEAIIAERNKNGHFKSLSDLCQRIDLRTVNKKVLECLIKSGACDGLNDNRATLYSIIDNSIDYAQKLKEDKDKGQFSLFGENNKTEPLYKPLINKINEWDNLKLLKYEKEVLGFYFSGHPLEKYLDKINKLNINRISKLKDYKEGSEVAICGLVRETRFLVSKKQTEYALITLEGLSGSCEIAFFKKTYADAKPLLVVDNILYIRGKLGSSEPSIKIIANKTKNIDNVNENRITPPIIKPIKPLQNINIEIKDMVIRQNRFDKIEGLKMYFLNHRGNVPVYIHFPPDGLKTKHVMVKAGNEFNLKITENLINEMECIDCVERAWIG